MKTISLEYVLKRGSCYGKKRLMEISGGRKKIKVESVFKLPIDHEDLLWLFLHDDFLSRKSIIRFACDCASRVLPIFEAQRPSDKRPRRAIEAARKTAVRPNGINRAAASAASAASAAGTAWDAAWAWQRKRLMYYVKKDAD